MSDVMQAIVVSDTHIGDRLGLCPPGDIQLDDGGIYRQSELQAKVWSWWFDEFWSQWVPTVTRRQPYAVIVNGDLMDGRHHGATTQISQNLSDQRKIARTVFEPIVAKCKGRFYVIRGTEAHTGQSAENEETLAQELGAIPNELGQHARWDMWARIGSRLAHITHHIGTTSSMQYETTALTREFAEACAEAGRWGLEAPAFVVRCLSDDTEILTKRGWKDKDSVMIGDTALTFNTFTEEMQWQTIRDKVTNTREENMVKFYGKGIDILVTPDHNMVCKWGKGGWKPIKAGELIRRRAIIPHAGWYNGTGVDLDNAELWLLGLIISDGTLVKNPRTKQAYAVRICQDIARQHEIEKRLHDANIVSFSVSANSKPGSEHYDHRHGRIITTRKSCLNWYIPKEYATKYIECVDGDKVLRTHMLEMTKDQFWSFMNGLDYGDGSTRYSMRRFHNTNMPLMDQLQELMTKHGAKSSLNTRETYTTKRGVFKTISVLNYIPEKNITEINQRNTDRKATMIPYAGGSWCVVVDNATLVTRRNGCVTIVGNSHRHRHAEVKVPTVFGDGVCVVTPGWQLKMMDLNTPLPTINGWTTMGEVKMGDKLFDEAGNLCNVIAVNPIDPKPETYEVFFGNGEQVKACADHLWLTTASVDKPGIPGHGGELRPLTRVRTTREILNTLHFGKKNTNNHRLAMPRALQLPKQLLPIDPYVLGCWLGDGDSDAARLTGLKDDIECYKIDFNRAGYTLTPQVVSKNKCPRYAIRKLSVDGNNTVSKGHPENFQHVLHTTGLIDNKHIPKIYLRSSFEQRLSLLQGLMDTDGHPDHLGRACFFVTTRPLIRDGMEDLLAGLGIKYTVVTRASQARGKTYGDMWIFRFFMSPDIMPVFRLQRKLCRVPLSSSRKTAQKSRGVSIIAVEPCDPVPMRCIAVDSPSKLYRFGKTMLYTHNTPFVWKGAGRNTNPQFGAVLLRAGDEEHFTRHFVRSIDRTPEVVL